MNETVQPAVAGPVEPTVRPAAVVCDQHISGGAIVRWAGSAMPCPPETLLYTQAALDAAVAAERERCKARAVQIVDWHRNDYNRQQIDPIVAELRNGL